MQVGDRYDIDVVAPSTVLVLARMLLYVQRVQLDAWTDVLRWFGWLDPGQQLLLLDMDGLLVNEPRDGLLILHLDRQVVETGVDAVLWSSARLGFFCRVVGVSDQREDWVTWLRILRRLRTSAVDLLQLLGRQLLDVYFGHYRILRVSQHEWRRVHQVLQLLSWQMLNAQLGSTGRNKQLLVVVVVSALIQFKAANPEWNALLQLQ